MLGLNPIEYYFHCQGGREGLVNIGVNTSDDGYIQRHILKSMQDIITQYNGFVRDGTDIVQFWKRQLRQYQNIIHTSKCVIHYCQ